MGNVPILTGNAFMGREEAKNYIQAKFGLKYVLIRKVLLPKNSIINFLVNINKY